MKALILAGGFGTRIKHLFPDIPKPMIPINGKPFLEILLERIINEGITEVYLAVHHQKEVIINHFGGRYSGVPVSYIEEKEPLGTGGAIKNATSTIKERFFVFNGDTMCTINLKQMQQMQGDITLGLKEVEDTTRYGRVVTNNRYITEFQEKGIPGKGLINAGIYLIQPHIFDGLNLPAKFSFEENFLKVYTNRILPTYFITDGYFIDIGIEEDYKKFCNEF